MIATAEPYSHLILHHAQRGICSPCNTHMKHACAHVRISVYIQSQIKSCPSLLILPNLTWEDITLKCENTYIFYIFFYCGPPLSIIIHLVYLGIGCNAEIGYLFHNVLQFAFKFVPFCSLLARFFCAVY